MFKFVLKYFTIFSFSLNLTWYLYSRSGSVCCLDHLCSVFHLTTQPHFPWCLQSVQNLLLISQMASARNDDQKSPELSSFPPFMIFYQKHRDSTLYWRLNSANAGSKVAIVSSPCGCQNGDHVTARVQLNYCGYVPWRIDCLGWEYPRVIAALDDLPSSCEWPFCTQMLVHFPALEYP